MFWSDYKFTLVDESETEIIENETTTIENDNTTLIDESVPFYSWNHGLESNLESSWNQKKYKKVDNSKEISWYKDQSDTIISDKDGDTNSTIIGENIHFKDFVKNKKRKISEIPRVVCMSPVPPKRTKIVKDKTNQPIKSMISCENVSTKQPTDQTWINM